MIDAQEHRIHHNGCHDEVLKYLRLHNAEVLESEAIDGLNWDNFRVGVNEESLNLDPFLLLFSEVVSSLSLFDFFIELVNNDGNEEVHDEEGSQENKDDVH